MDSYDPSPGASRATARASARERSERWRERRRKGLMPVTVSVSRAHRQALERLGLIAPEMDRDREALAWAVERFLDTAPAIAAIGAALYPTAEDFAEPDPDDEGAGDEAEGE